MHYPRKISRIKKIRKQGFRPRMSTSKGRKLIARQRRIGRSMAPVISNRPEPLQSV